MSLTYTPVVIDTFQRADENPLNPMNWHVPSGAFACQIVSDFCEGTVPGGDSISMWTGLGTWTKGAQYEKIKIHSMAEGSTFDLFILSDAELSVVTLDSYFTYSAGILTLTIYDIKGNPLASSVTTPFVADAEAISQYFQGTLNVYYNGALIQTVSGLGALFDNVQGLPGFDLGTNGAITDVEINYFEAGNISDASSVTTSVNSPGTYFGQSLERAFQNPNQFDLIQVVNEGGDVIWCLNFAGLVTTNPANQANPTLDTYLGKYRGQTFADAFPYLNKLNIFQVVNQGGHVIFFVDYQGNAATN